MVGFGEFDTSGSTAVLGLGECDAFEKLDVLGVFDVVALTDVVSWWAARAVRATTTVVPAANTSTVVAPTISWLRRACRRRGIRVELALNGFTFDGEGSGPIRVAR